MQARQNKMDDNKKLLARFRNQLNLTQVELSRRGYVRPAKETSPAKKEAAGSAIAAGIVKNLAVLGTSSSCLLQGSFEQAIQMVDTRSDVTLMEFIYDSPIAEILAADGIYNAKDFKSISDELFETLCSKLPNTQRCKFTAALEEYTGRSFNSACINSRYQARKRSLPNC